MTDSAEGEAERCHICDKPMLQDGSTRYHANALEGVRCMQVRPLDGVTDFGEDDGAEYGICTHCGQPFNEGGMTCQCEPDEYYENDL